jgi:hypothetical protein
MQLLIGGFICLSCLVKAIVAFGRPVLRQDEVSSTARGNQCQVLLK